MVSRCGPWRRGSNVPLCVGCRRALVCPTNVMTRQQVLDLYFMDARFKLIELAAFLDRVERASGKDDFRIEAFRSALGELSKGNKEKARQVLLSFSDPTTEPIAKATVKG